MIILSIFIFIFCCIVGYLFNKEVMDPLNTNKVTKNKNHTSKLIKKLKHIVGVIFPIVSSAEFILGFLIFVLSNIQSLFNNGVWHLKFGTDYYIHIRYFILTYMDNMLLVILYFIAIILFICYFYAVIIPKGYIEKIKTFEFGLFLVSLVSLIGLLNIFCTIYGNWLLISKIIFTLAIIYVNLHWLVIYNKFNLTRKLILIIVIDIILLIILWYII